MMMLLGLGSSEVAQGTVIFKVALIFYLVTELVVIFTPNTDAVRPPGSGMNHRKIESDNTEGVR